jgi:hypothetical protein
VESLYLYSLIPHPYPLFTKMPSRTGRNKASDELFSTDLFSLTGEKYKKHHAIYANNAFFITPSSLADRAGVGSPFPSPRVSPAVIQIQHLRCNYIISDSFVTFGVKLCFIIIFVCKYVIED